MKKIKIQVAAMSILCMLFAAMPVVTKAYSPYPPVSVSFQFFYDNLSPYGSWVENPSYGYAWVPAGEPGFRPYFSGGHWVFTDEGWMWASNYEWGWAPFHYGSWVEDPYYGWMWVPGYDWAPAWVTWGSYGDYYGWAPCGPGFSVSFSNYYPPTNYWVFVHPRYLAEGNWGSNYYAGRGDRITINNTTINNVHNITIINNVNNYNARAYNAGPQRQAVERVANTTLRPIAVRESARPGKTVASGNGVSIYRPMVSRDKESARPAKVEPMKGANGARGGANGRAVVAPPKGRESISPKGNNKSAAPVFDKPGGGGRRQDGNGNGGRRQGQLQDGNGNGSGNVGRRQQQGQDGNVNGGRRQGKVQDLNAPPEHARPDSRRLEGAPPVNRQEERVAPPREREPRVSPAERQPRMENREPQPREERVAPPQRQAAPREERVMPREEQAPPRDLEPRMNEGGREQQGMPVERRQR